VTRLPRRLRTALPALLAVLLVAVGPAPAQAHDELIGSDPRDGATLDEAPDGIVLTFSGDISDLGAQVALQDAAGRSLTDGTPRVAGTEVEQDLPDLGAGDYTVLWRVTSADGHPISGELAFTVTGDDPTSATSTAGGGSTDEETADPTGTAPAAEPTTQATTGPGTAPDGVDDGAGLPGWAWVVVGAAVLGLLALLGRTWARGRR
jgi:hypothetical protein